MFATEERGDRGLSQRLRGGVPAPNSLEWNGPMFAGPAAGRRSREAIFSFPSDRTNIHRLSNILSSIMTTSFDIDANDLKSNPIYGTDWIIYAISRSRSRRVESIR